MIDSTLAPDPCVTVQNTFSRRCLKTWKPGSDGWSKVAPATATAPRHEGLGR